jgi:hypothetical protein
VAPRQPRAPGEPAYAYERLPPEGPPPRGPWWESPWPAVLVAIIALLVGGGIGYAIGNSEESGHASTFTQTQTTTNTVTQPKTVVQTVTASTVRETPAPANPANEERRREAEANLKKAEKENQELKKMLEEAGRSP